MNKKEFLVRLRQGLSGLPKDDVEERVCFYEEMIDDQMEEGLSEEEAVCRIGDVDALISQIIADTPLTKLVKEKIKSDGRLRAWEIVLLVLGAPVWFSLIVAAIAVIFAIYLSLWAVVVALWAVFGALAGCAVGSVAGFVVFLAGGNGVSAVAVLAAGLVCAGLSVFVFLGCKAVTKCILALTKAVARWIKKCFVGKEAGK